MKINRFLLILLLVGMCGFLISCGSNLVTDGAVEYHHIFPQQFRETFAQKGINVDDFTIALTKKDHRGKGKGLQYVPKDWNKEWNEWLQRNPNFTQEDASAKAQEMMLNAGCKGEFHFFDYNTKKLSGATVAGATSMFVCSNNWFLKICGKFGYWLLNLLGGSNIGGQILSILAAIGATVLGWFGIKAEHPVAIGVGLICIILGIIACIGLIIFVKWIIGVIIAAGVGGAKVISD